MLCAIACFGLVLKITVAATAPEAFGEYHAVAVQLAGAAPWVLMLTFGAAQATAHAIRRRSGSHESARNETADATQMQPDERRAVVRARRRATGMPSSILGRADFVHAMENALDREGARASTFSATFTRMEVEGLDVDREGFLFAEMANAISEQLSEGQVAGYLGAGLFGVGMPQTSYSTGGETFELIHGALLDIAADYDGGLRDVFLTSLEDESAAELYRRGMTALRDAASTRATRQIA